MYSSMGKTREKMTKILMLREGSLCFTVASSAHPVLFLWVEAFKGSFVVLF